MPNKRSRPSSDTEDGQKKRRDTNEGKASAAQDEDPQFDEWLREELTELYAPVLKEPIPDELMDIIKKHR